jgi:outer membrane lipoprotein SlyB
MTQLSPSNRAPLRATSLILVLSAALAACDSLDKKTVGTVTGGVVGAVAGSQIGKGKGRVLATIVGAAAGAYVGSRIGDRLEERDKEKMSEATKKAAATDRAQSFVNDSSGVAGKAEVVETQTRDVQVAEQKVEQRECKTIKQTVMTKSGEQVTEDVITCKGPNGWELAG